jgi:hypothetical protein
LEHQEVAQEDLETEVAQEDLEHQEEETEVAAEASVEEAEEEEIEVAEEEPEEVEAELVQVPKSSFNHTRDSQESISSEEKMMLLSPRISPQENQSTMKRELALR